MKSFRAGALCIVAAIAVSSWQAHSAFAGFTYIHVDPADSSNPYPPTWESDINLDGSATLEMSENFADYHEGEYGVNVWGTTDSDPILTVVKTVTNTTSFPWIGYHIDLDPLDTDTFVGVSSSSMMTLAFQDAYNVDFGLPAPVNPGDTVSFTVQVNVPDIGGFQFTLTQAPELVPEPTAMALAGLGSLALGLISVRRNRRS